MRHAVRLIIAVASTGAVAVPALAQGDLLPDIIVRDSDLYDNDVRILGGSRFLRLSNGTANIGDGKLYLYGVFPPNDDGTITVRQRVYGADGSFYDRDAGNFVFHPEHDHIHFENWAVYRLREVLDGGGVGDIVAEGEKTSFCILDLGIYDTGLPNFDPDGQFHSCNSTVQGLSVGWIDIYSKNLAGQRIDITGVPDGQYWLESEVDPLDAVLEKDESNNTTRVLVNIGGDGGPDYAEPNGSIGQVEGRLEGGANSPNLGPCGPERTVPDLTIHDPGDDDYFRFVMNDTGGPGDFVRIDFDQGQGDIDLALYDESGGTVRVSHGGDGFERVSLEGLSEGWYFARAFGFDGDTSPGYSLTINPSENEAPVVDVLTPPPGDTVLEHGAEALLVEWAASDPEGDSTWVTIYLNHHPELDEHAILIPTSLNTQGGLGFHLVNSAYVPPDTYWVIAEITDGGTISHGVSPGTVTFIEICPGDMNRDGRRDTLDVLSFLNAWAAGDVAADFNRDGTVDTLDVLEFLNAWNGPC